MPPLAQQIVDWFEIPYEGLAPPERSAVFALGNFGRQVTFSAQQTRAFNLVWGLCETGRLKPGDHVAVVGAGLAGLTAAVAALNKDCQVDLFEQASQPCALQRGNDIRFIHPNILRWPEEGSENEQTAFPYLNWTAATVRGVIRQVAVQWDALTADPGMTKLRQYLNYQVAAVEGGERPWLMANRLVTGQPAAGPVPGHLTRSYQAIFLAVGFGLERVMLGVPALSYWENDNLHQEMSWWRGPRAILVSGCGDGGLIDALRLRVRNFDHAEFVRLFTQQAAPLTARLLEIDRELRGRADAPDLGRQFQERYDALASQVPPAVVEYFTSRSRPDTRVTLNSPDPHPLTFRGSLLNRFAVYLAMKYADLHYRPGRVVVDRTPDERYRVAFRVKDRDAHLEVFDRLIIRHGPDPAIRQLIPGWSWERMEERAKQGTDPTTGRHWEAQDPPFYRPINPTAPDVNVTLAIARENFDAAYRTLVRHEGVLSVAVGRHGESSGYVVTLAPGKTTPAMTTFALVPVLYRAEPVPAAPPRPKPAKPTPKPVVTPPDLSRLLVQAGAGIFNFDARRRLEVELAERERVTGFRGQSGGVNDPPRRQVPGGFGTLGCFVVKADGTRLVLSANHVLSLINRGQHGDGIRMETADFPDGRPIGRFFGSLPLVYQGKGDPFINIADAALAELAPDVAPDWRSFNPVGGPPVKVGDVDPGEQVVKIGRSSGVTFGRVTTVDISPVTVMLDFAEVAVFGGCFEIEGVSGRDFSLPGDSGALIVRQRDRAAVGVLTAGVFGSGPQRPVTIACPLRPTMKALDVELLRP